MFQMFSLKSVDKEKKKTGEGSCAISLLLKLHSNDALKY